MKREIALIVMMIAMSHVSIYPQTLSNTTWKVYDTDNIFYLYFHFGTDTISSSVDDMAYKNISVFQEDGNILKMIDLIRDNACPNSDTGTYSFLVQNDILEFSLIEDPCEERSIVVSAYHWTRVLTGMQQTNLNHDTEIYPNPVKDVISIKSDHHMQGSSYILFDMSGRQVLNGTLTNEITSVGVRHLPVGLYFLQIGEKGKQPIKILKN